MPAPDTAPEDAPRICEFEGCENALTGPPTQRFCSPEHRVIAWRYEQRAANPLGPVILNCALAGCSNQFERRSPVHRYCSREHRLEDWYRKRRAETGAE